MIVDVHTHTPTHQEAIPPGEVIVNDKWRPDRAVRATNTWADYLEALQPVDKAIVFNIALRVGDSSGTVPDPTGVEGVNDRTAQFVAHAPEKLIGFLSVHPDVPGSLDEIERSTQDLGLKGVKLGPNYQRFDPLGETARSVYRRAEELGLPILFHQGTSPIRTAPIRYAHPLVMDEIAIEFPELRIVMAHMGHPWQADTITVIRKHPHVYADISGLFYRPWSFYNALRLATEWNVLPKLLFGSDFPVTTPQENIDALRSVNGIVKGSGLPPVPEDALEEIIYRESLELLGLEG